MIELTPPQHPPNLTKAQEDVITVMFACTLECLKLLGYTPKQIAATYSERRISAGFKLIDKRKKPATI